MATLCKQLGVEDFNALWDTLFEVEARPDAEDFRKRCHAFCLHCRLLDEDVRPADRRREAFMAEEVRKVLDGQPGQVVVVTGGYRSSALHARLNGLKLAGAGAAADPEPVPIPADGERGIALTPYSYERLDSLTGYDAGMPSPGFYHRLWEDREAGRGLTYRWLLRQVVKMLRERGQQFSAADLIAVETTARALAALRGHDEVWRWDLVDGITSALVKEELAHGFLHPLLQAVHEVFRGGERGRLAEGTVLPPLVLDLRRLLREYDLEARQQARTVKLDLSADGDRPKSRVLHRLRTLGIAGYQLVDATDLVGRDDLTTVWERWELLWNPDLEATSIEAARYGPTLEDATAARLMEQAAALERDAEKAALLLMDACLAGLPALTRLFQEKLAELIRGDCDFFQVSAALGHLVYLFRYDEVLLTTGRSDLGSLLSET